MFDSICNVVKPNQKISQFVLLLRVSILAYRFTGNLFVKPATKLISTTIATLQKGLLKPITHETIGEKS
jgi:hypothetical protein